MPTAKRPLIWVLARKFLRTFEMVSQKKKKLLFCNLVVGLRRPGHGFPFAHVAQYARFSQGNDGSGQGFISIS